jgi:hypothetical protein
MKCRCDIIHRATGWEVFIEGWSLSTHTARDAAIHEAQQHAARARESGRTLDVFLWDDMPIRLIDVELPVPVMH